MDLGITPAAASASGLETASSKAPKVTSGPSGSRAHSAVPGKTRSSCDRCHGQKLRCVKEEDSITCQRCLRLKTICRYSARTTRSSMKSRDRIHSHQPMCDVPLPFSGPSEDMLSIPLDGKESDSSWLPTEEAICSAIEPVSICSGTSFTTWSDLTAQDMLCVGGLKEVGDINSPAHSDPINRVFVPPGDIMKQTFPLINISHGPTTRDDIRRSLSSTFRQLASISVQVYECGQNLPSAQIQDVTSASAPSPGIHLNDARKSAKFLFDELFRLTAEFIGVLKSLSVSENDTDSPAVSAFQGQVPSVSPESLISFSPDLSSLNQPFGETYAASSRRPLPQTDEATTFMIMSCHSRLVETYTAILQMMQLCLEHSLIPQTGHSWAVILPRLQVGSLALPALQVDDKTPVSSKATSTMYMIMVTMLCFKLWTQMASVMRGWARDQSETALAANCSLVEGMCSAAMDKTDCLIQKIDAIKSQLNL